MLTAFIFGGYIALTVIVIVLGVRQRNIELELHEYMRERFAIVFEKLNEEEVCRECGCYLDKHLAKKVKTIGVYGSYENLYCGRCKPPYDTVIYNSVGETTYRRNDEVRVNQDGTPWKQSKN